MRARETRQLGRTFARSQIPAIGVHSSADDLPRQLAELGASYEPERLAAMFAGRRGELASRALVVTGALGGFASALARDWATGSLARNMGRRAEQLARTLSKLGPLFVKVGQALSMRPDLIPKEYLEALARLQVRL